MNTSRIIRRFERYLFKGIPEQPEPVWERNANTIVRERHTGKTTLPKRNRRKPRKSDVIGYFVYDFKNNKESYHKIRK